MTLLVDVEEDRTPVRTTRRTTGLLVALLALVVVLLLSLALGSKLLPLDLTVEALFRDNGEPHTIVVEQRIPRTVVGLMVGIALAVAGALMQGMTRNALADPGLLGVSSGASFAIVLGAVLLPGVTRLEMVWCAFAGAVITTVIVYVIGSAGGRNRSPVTLVLAGVAISAVLEGIASTLEILRADALLTARAWRSGSLEMATWDDALLLGVFLVLGLLLAAVAARGLNAVALGDDLAAALGASQAATRVAVIVGVTLLCGAATSVIGMVWFVGLMVPHVARWITGPDQRWILAYCCLLGPILMVGADVVGRLVMIPDEIPAGLVTAFVGAPVLIWMVRRKEASGL